MLLLLSNWIICQNTNTVPVNNIQDIYKGLKQNSFLKEKLESTENALESCNKLVIDYKTGLENRDAQLSKKDQLINNYLLEYEMRTKLKDLEIQKKEDLNNILQNTIKITHRKRFWSGFKTGLGIGIVGAAALLIVTSQ